MIWIKRALPVAATPYKEALKIELKAGRRADALNVQFRDVPQELNELLGTAYTAVVSLKTCRPDSGRRAGRGALTIRT